MDRLRLEGSDHGWRSPEGLELAEIEVAEWEKGWRGNKSLKFFLFFKS